MHNKFNFSGIIGVEVATTTGTAKDLDSVRARTFLFSGKKMSEDYISAYFLSA